MSSTLPPSSPEDTTRTNGERPTRRRGGRASWILPLLALLAGVLVTASAAQAQIGGDSSLPGVLMVSQSPDGDLDRLDGAELAGDVFISFDPDINASEVRYYIGDERNQYTYVRAVRQAPFPLFEAADGTAKPFDTTVLEDGRHVIWATYNDRGRWRHIGHEIQVDNAGTTSDAGEATDTTPAPTAEPTATATPPAEPTPVPELDKPWVPALGSDTDPQVPAGSGVLLATDADGVTVRLDGATIGGNVVIWLDPAIDATEVRFYVGKKRDNNELRQRDYTSPFHLAEESDGTPIAVSADSLGETIFATYQVNGLWRHVRHDFSQGATTVAATGGDSTPTNEATPTPEPTTPVTQPTVAPTPVPTTPAPTATPAPASPTPAPTTPPANDPPAPSTEVQDGDIVVDSAGALRSTLESSIAPGTTVWLRGGTYVGEFVSRADGTAADPIVIRSYPGEQAVIDGDKSYGGTPTVSIEGDWQTWTDLEFTNSATGRNLGSGSVGRPTLLHLLGRGTALINNDIHDGGVCVGWWKSAVDSVVYGNVIYDCGWDGSDRPHGHALYVQSNDDGRKLLEHNVVSSTYGRSMIIYGSNQVHNVDVYGNVFAGGHSLGSEVKSPVYIDGAVDDLNFVGNHVYTLEKEPVSIRSGGTNSRFENNYLMTRSDALAGIWVRGGNSIVGSGNHIFAPGNLIRQESGARFGAWNNNTYYGSSSFYAHGGFADWQNRNGYDAGSSLASGMPTHVSVSPNRYDGDRGMVTIWNGSQSSSVSVNVSSILEPGDTYVVLGSQDLGGAPLLSGTYNGGSLSFPMTGRSVGSAVGGATPDAWGSEFGSFVILGS